MLLTIDLPLYIGLFVNYFHGYGLLQAFRRAHAASPTLINKAHSMITVDLISLGLIVATLTFGPLLFTRSLRNLLLMCIVSAISGIVIFVQPGSVVVSAVMPYVVCAGALGVLAAIAHDRAVTRYSLAMLVVVAAGIPLYGAFVPHVFSNASHANGLSWSASVFFDALSIAGYGVAFAFVTALKPALFHARGVVSYIKQMVLPLVALLAIYAGSVGLFATWYLADYWAETAAA